MVCGPIVNSFFVCFCNIRGWHASPLVSSLCEMSNLEHLVPQHHQASGSQRPAVDRALLRRLYFLNSDRSKYVCLGFYPNRCYRAFFVVGWVRKAPVVLPPSLFLSLAFHLSKLCDHLVKGEQFKCNQMSFRMQNVAENSANIVLDLTSITLRLHELQYLVLNLTTLSNQVAR